MQSAALDLMGAVWPHVPPAVTRAETFGANLFDFSHSIVRMDGGVAVAHVGLMDTPLRVSGRDLNATELHAVCVREGSRGRGLMRSVMEECITLTAGASWLHVSFDMDVLDPTHAPGTGTHSGRWSLKRVAGLCQFL